MGRRNGTTRLLPFVATAIALLGLMLGMSTPANAFAYETDLANQLAPFSTEDQGCTSSGIIANSYYFACFKPNGDTFYESDNAKDSQSVGIYWQFIQNGGVQRSGICLDKHGEGPETRCVKNFAEDGYVHYRIGRCNGSSHNCFYLDSYTNWSGWKNVNTG